MILDKFTFLCGHINNVLRSCHNVKYLHWLGRDGAKVVSYFCTLILSVLYLYVLSNSFSSGIDKKMEERTLEPRQLHVNHANLLRYNLKTFICIKLIFRPLALKSV